jgi:hypothetical protein
MSALGSGDASARSNGIPESVRLIWQAIPRNNITLVRRIRDICAIRRLRLRKGDERLNREHKDSDWPLRII